MMKFSCLCHLVIAKVGVKNNLDKNQIILKHTKHVDKLP